MLQQAARSFGRVIKYTGKNVNVTAHNKELRKEVTGDVTFLNTFNMGYEGFSKGWKLPKMNPNHGNKWEFLFLALLCPTIVVLKAARFGNEDSIRSSLGFANNRYAPFATVKPTQW